MKKAFTQHLDGLVVAFQKWPMERAAPSQAKECFLARRQALASVGKPVEIGLTKLKASALQQDDLWY